MDETLDAHEVLSVNAITHRRFRGRVLGRFARTGFLQDEARKEIAVPPGTQVQVEAEGAVFRMSADGRVLRIEWLPTLVEQIGAVGDARSEFLRTCVTEHRRQGASFRAATRREPDRRA